MKIKLIILLGIFLISSVLAVSAPHAFHGTVKYTDNTIVEGELIVKFNEEEFQVKLNNGEYEITVESSNPDRIVEFYFNNEKIGEANFESFEVSELNFVVLKISLSGMNVTLVPISLFLASPATLTGYDGIPLLYSCL